jgi:hypothetical protein
MELLVRDAPERCDKITIVGKDDEKSHIVRLQRDLPILTLE